MIPADCILIKSTRYDGQVFTKTTTLDGMRNLKSLQAQMDIQNSFDSIFDPNSSRKTLGKQVASRNIEFAITEPFQDLDLFRGSARIDLHGEGSPPKSVDLTIKQFLHRGAVIHNSDRVLAMVAYTGHQTKLAMNIAKAKSKKSLLDR